MPDDDSDDVDQGARVRREASRIAAAMLAALGACATPVRDIPIASSSPAVSTPRSDAVAVPPSGAVATVGGVPITVNRVDELMSPDAVVIATGKSSRPLDRASRRRMVDLLVYHELLALECRRSRIEFDPRELPMWEEVYSGHPGIADALERNPRLAHVLRSRIVADQCEEKLLAARGTPMVPDEDFVFAYERRHGAWNRDEPWVRVTIATIEPLPSESAFTTCEAFLAEYRRCIDDKVPESQREAMGKELQAFTRDHEADVAKGGSQAARSKRCALERDRVRKATLPLSCDWTSNAPTEQPRTTRSRASEGRRVADRLRRAVRDGVDLEAAARAAGFQTTTELEPLGHLAPAIAAAIRKLRDGEVSGALVAEDGIARLVQRRKSWPKGTLPKSEPELNEVIEDVPNERLQRVLQAELMQRYEVIVSPAPEPAPKP